MTSQIEHILSLAERATPAPWASDASVAMHDRPDLPCVVDEFRLVVAQFWDDGHTEDECEANAELVAALRNLDLPKLVAKLEAIERLARASGQTFIADEISAILTAEKL